MNAENRNKREVEQWLDEALSQYAKVEPRPGLEARVLARLAADQQESTHNWRWWNVLALSTEVVALVALFWLSQVDRTQVSQPPVAKVSPAPQVEMSPQGRDRHSQTGQYSVIHHSSLLAKNDRSPGELGVPTSAPPQLEQFPSPLPLTDQERMLAHYVQDFPKKAAFVATAQTELYNQDELEMSALWPTNGTANDLEKQK
jgi:hypothetical protein